MTVSCSSTQTTSIPSLSKIYIGFEVNRIKKHAIPRMLTVQKGIVMCILQLKFQKEIFLSKSLEISLLC